MSNMMSGGRQTLTAVVVIVVVALLATQTYALLALAGSRSTVVVQPGGSSTASSNTVTVSGTGQGQVQPDRAILTIGVVTQAATADSAAAQNANTMSGVISALEGIGISSDDIQTVSYNISPQSSCCNGPPTITGFQVTNEVMVTVIASGQTLAQLGAKAGQAVDTAASQGANQVYGISFAASSSAIKQAQQDALRQAMLNASSEAQVAASALGVTVTGVLSATVSSGYTPPVYYRDLATAGGASTPIIAPEFLTVTANVQVVYHIG